MNKALELNLAGADDDIKIVETNDGTNYIGTVSEMLGKVFVAKCLGLLIKDSQEQRGTFQIGFVPPVHPAIGILDEDARGAVNMEFYATSVKFQTQANEQILKMYKEAVSGIEIAKVLPGLI